MASEYSVNIRLNTAQVKKDLESIKKDIKTLGKVNIGSSQRAQRTEAKITKSKDAQRAAMVETRRIGDLVQKAADQGLKVDKARRAINKASLADGRQDFKTAKAQQKVALEELKTQRAITKEKGQQARLSQSIGRQMASPIGGTRTMMGSPLQLGFAGAGMGRSPLQGTRFQFGSPAFFEAGARAGGARSPITGSRFTFGSPAFNAAQGVGAPRVPIGGRSDLVGSPANLLSIGRQNAMPVKGFESLVGSPAYFEAQNKEILRIAKQNAVPIRGFKHLVGSPAYFKDQAAKLKKIQTGASTGFRASQFGPQAPPINVGARSDLNFRGNTLLRGPAGTSVFARGNLGRLFQANRGAALQSAAISGAFPLLFGQGPLAALGGGVGGGLGGVFGGQMGGFAGGLIGTAVVSGIQGFTSSISQLGQAINSVNKDTTPLIQALGLTGSEYEKQIKTLESLGDQEAAFDLVRQKMTQQVGSDGVQALSNFGDQTKKLSDSFSVFMLNMRVGIANLIEQAGVLRALARSVETGVGMERARTLAADDPEIANLINQFENVGKRGLGGSIVQAFRDPQADKREKDRILDEITALVKKKDTEREIKAINEAINKAAQKKINTDIRLLEMSREEGHLSELEFEIQQKIQELKDKDIEVDEKALANKMRKLDALQKERQLALETAAAFERMSQTIATDISQGIQGMIRGTSTLNDLLNNVLNKLIDAAFNMAFFGNPQGTLGGGGLFGSIFSGLGSLFSPVPDPTFGTGIPSGASLPAGSFGISSITRASGGPVKGGTGYLVGERGPEMFTPGVSGMITPNHALGGTTNVVVNVDASGSSVEGDEEQGRELGRIISAAIQSELIKQKRPGGMLA